MLKWINFARVDETECFISRLNITTDERRQSIIHLSHYIFKIIVIHAMFRHTVTFTMEWIYLVTIAPFLFLKNYLLY